MRWGELTEIRVRDLDFETCILTVSRAVVELTPGEHADGARFLVKDYPKDKEYRRFKLSQQIVSKIRVHVTAKELGDDDLLFTYQGPEQPRNRRRSTVSAPPPGMTEPNEKGRRYRHGTMTAYNAARCRCEHCRGAYAAYRAVRRASGKDEPRVPRARDTDGHIPADWFHHQVWDPARKACGLGQVRIHDLRHAHASWLLAGGADLQVVKERLGHASIATALVLAPPPTATDAVAGAKTCGRPGAPLHWAGDVTRQRSGMGLRPGLLRDARIIYQDAAARGERLSQRTLARQLRGHGHRFPNEHLHWIAGSIGLTADQAA